MERIKEIKAYKDSDGKLYEDKGVCIAGEIDILFSDIISILLSCRKRSYWGECNSVSKDVEDCMRKLRKILAYLKRIEAEDMDKKSKKLQD